jgi:exopolysaccharide production protein ExoY
MSVSGIAKRRNWRHPDRASVEIGPRTLAFGNMRLRSSQSSANGASSALACAGGSRRDELNAYVSARFVYAALQLTLLLLRVRGIIEQEGGYMQQTYDGVLASTDGPAAISAGPAWDEGLWRAIDVIIASIALIFFLPLMGVIALIIIIRDPGPVLFAHRRIGRHGRMFPCLKFRSMAVDAEQRLAELLATDPAAREEWARDHKLKNDPRVTPIGEFLRRSSLDELPQLFNVLRGEMSLVGPRPIVPGEVERYGRHIHKYCTVRPGITGLWQIGGRNDVSYRRRVALDVTYTRNRSTLLNLQILVLTVPNVLMAKGSY